MENKEYSRFSFDSCEVFDGIWKGEKIWHIHTATAIFHFEVVIIKNNVESLGSNGLLFD